MRAPCCAGTDLVLETYVAGSTARPQKSSRSTSTSPPPPITRAGTWGSGRGATGLRPDPSPDSDTPGRGAAGFLPDPSPENDTGDGTLSVMALIDLPDCDAGAFVAVDVIGRCA